MADDYMMRVHIRSRMDALTCGDQPMYLLSGQDPYSSSRHRASTLTSRRRFARPPWTHAILGITTYYLKFLVVMGGSWLLQALSLFSFYYALRDLPTSLQDPTRGINARSILLLSGFFMGECVGSVVFGSCADHYGRKRSLLVAISISILGHVLLCASWSNTSLIVFRALSGFGLGGQSAMVLTIVLEFTPQHTRGRMVVLCQVVGALGTTLAVPVGLSLPSVLSWRGMIVLLAVLLLGYAILVATYLGDSPKYLASIGRVDQALRVLAGMERAHGIDRQARVTVPSSLYEPPAASHRRVHTVTIFDEPNRSAVTDTGDSPPSHHRSSEVITLDRDHPHPHPPPPAISAAPRRRRTSAAASPAMVSFLVSCGKRFTVILCRRPYVKRTLLLWSMWFLLWFGFACSISYLALYYSHDGHKLKDRNLVVWGAMPIPGLIISAVIIERMGRITTLVLTLMFSAIASTAVALLVPESSTDLSIALLLISLSMVTGALSAYTGEQYGLMVRAMGIGWAFAWGYMGAFVGVVLVLDASEHGWQWYWDRQLTVLATHACICILVMILVRFLGVETKNQDIDIAGSSSKNDGGVFQPNESLAMIQEAKDDRSFDTSQEGGLSLPITYGFQPNSSLGVGTSVTPVGGPSAYTYSPRSSSSSSGFWQKRQSSSARRKSSSKKKRRTVRMFLSSKRGRKSQQQQQDLNFAGGGNHVPSKLTMVAPQSLRYSSSSSSRQSANYSSSETPSQQQRPPMAFVDWRESDGSSSHDSRATAPRQTAGRVNDNKPPRVGRYTIDMDMFDTFTYVSTPVLGGSQSPKPPAKKRSSSQDQS